MQRSIADSFGDITRGDVRASNTTAQHVAWLLCLAVFRDCYAAVEQTLSSLFYHHTAMEVCIEILLMRRDIAWLGSAGAAGYKGVAIVSNLPAFCARLFTLSRPLGKRKALFRRCARWWHGTPRMTESKVYPQLFCRLVHMAWRLADASPCQSAAAVDFFHLAVVTFAAELAFLLGLRLGAPVAAFIARRPRVKGAVLVALCWPRSWRVALSALRGPALGDFARLMQACVADASCLSAASLWGGLAGEIAEVAIELAAELLHLRGRVAHGRFRRSVAARLRLRPGDRGGCPAG